MKRFIALLLAISLTLTACAGSAAAPSAPQSGPAPAGAPEPVPQPEPEPVFQWETDDPEHHRMDPEVLVRLHEALASSNVYAMVTVKDGVIIDEYY